MYVFFFKVSFFLGTDSKSLFNLKYFIYIWHFNLKCATLLLFSAWCFDFGPNWLSVFFFLSFLTVFFFFFCLYGYNHSSYRILESTAYMSAPVVTSAAVTSCNESHFYDEYLAGLKTKHNLGHF